MLLVDNVLEEGSEGSERTSARAERTLGRLKYGNPEWKEAFFDAVARELSTMQFHDLHTIVETVYSNAAYMGGWIPSLDTVARSYLPTRCTW